MRKLRWRQNVAIFFDKNYHIPKPIRSHGQTAFLPSAFQEIELNILLQYSHHLTQTSANDTVSLFLGLVIKINKNFLCKRINKIWFSWNVKHDT